MCMHVCMCASLCVHVEIISLITPYPQRIATSLRVGGPKEICLERFVEALQDTESGLTHPALVATRKSVEDVE